jgi:hypothetical protein
MVGLWEAGLKYLLYSQIHEYFRWWGFTMSLLLRPWDGMGCG